MIYSGTEVPSIASVDGTGVSPLMKENRESVFSVPIF